MSLKSSLIPSMPIRIVLCLVVLFGSVAFALHVLEASYAKVKTVAPSAPMRPQPKMFDFDGDGLDDVGRWQASSQQFIVKSTNGGTYLNYEFGSPTAKAAPGDYNGDGTTDAAVFEAITGTWTYKTSPNATPQTISLGQSGDIPVARDFDGDSTTDAAVFRPSDGTWRIKQSSDGSTQTITFGQTGDIPIPSMFGRGEWNLAVFRPSTTSWHIHNGPSNLDGLVWGTSTDVPMTSDFDGDFISDIGRFRPADGSWTVLLSSRDYSDDTEDILTQGWGNYGDQPVPADYDGDGIDDLAVWRPTTGTWHIRESSTEKYMVKSLGIPGDMAVPSSYLRQSAVVVYGDTLGDARLSPKNAVGGTDPYSGNFSWGTSLVNLPGRAGHDAGLGVSYNSLIWIKDTVANQMVFDPDRSNITPGFRLGFPVIEPGYMDVAKDKGVYIMVLPSGRRVEFIQQQATWDYESTDGTYTKLAMYDRVSPDLPIEDIPIWVTTADGTSMTFELAAGLYKCTKVKDRHGNYIVVDHDEESGLLDKITDTLGREISIQYNAFQHPTTVTQQWKNNNGQGGVVPRTYATFSYGNIQLNTNFPSGTSVIGPPSGSSIRVLSGITYGDGSSTKFDYNSYGQVTTVSTGAADSPTHILNQIEAGIGLSSPQSDCPRMGSITTSGENFPTVSTSNTGPTATTVTLPDGEVVTGSRIQTATANHPNNLISQTIVASSGFAEGLPLATLDCIGSCSGSNIKRWTWTKWLNGQNELGAVPAYRLNPRIDETVVGDEVNVSGKGTKITYHSELLFGTQISINPLSLPKKIEVYDGSISTVIHETAIVYQTPIDTYSPWTANPMSVETRGLNSQTGALEDASKVTYGYDEYPHQNLSNVYGFEWGGHSGDLTSITRHAVVGTAPPSRTSFQYNVTGSLASTTTPSNGTTTPTTTFAYTDSFNDNIVRNTYAYPTTITDPAGYSSQIKYRHDFGANVWAKSPNLNTTTVGKTTTREYDALGRLILDKVENNGAYTEYEYSQQGNSIRMFTTLVDVDNSNSATPADEVESETITDGAGRVIKSRSQHPGSVGGWSATSTTYDMIGRPTSQSAPTEVDASWNPAGDDAGGWRVTAVEYDWKGRVKRSINPDGSDTTNEYAGCGCAGGETVISMGEQVAEGRRTQKSYADPLGRHVKTEMFDWSGAIYKTLTNNFNGRNQVVSSKIFVGTNGESRETISEYDGHGRLKFQREPRQNSGLGTSYTYYPDDKIETAKDARNATKHYSYTALGLISWITWTVPQPSNIEVPVPVGFSYDNVGNRTGMSDGAGGVVYVYNSLSQLTSETRQFYDTVSQSPTGDNKFKIEYAYTFGGGLASYKEPFGEEIKYGFDNVGRVTSVAGHRTIENTQINYVNDAEYRAWGAAKSISYAGNINMSLIFNARMAATQYDFGTTRLKYQYFNDGKLKSSDTDYSPSGPNYEPMPNFDRSYHYDFLGRLKAAKTGVEAAGGVETDATKRPYRLVLGYNAFGDVVNQERRHWHLESLADFSFENGRMISEERDKVLPNWFTNHKVITHTFDADGRPTDNGEKYDAEGRQTRFNKGEQTYSSSKWFETAYDGDGRLVRTKDVDQNCYAPSNPPCFDTTQTFYMVASSVLGEPVVEIEQKVLNPTTVQLGRKISILASGQEIAQRELSYVGTINVQDVWQFKSLDPSGVEHSTYQSLSSGFNPSSVTMDPLGAGIGSENPYPDPGNAPDPDNPDDCDFDYDHDGGDQCTYPGEYEDTDSEQAEAGSVSANTCYIEGVEQLNCDEFAHLADIHDAVVTKDKDFPDSVPSDSGPQGIHQNDDPSDDDGHGGNSGEQEFEQQYSGADVSFGAASGVSVTVSASNVIGSASDWDLRGQSLPSESNNNSSSFRDDCDNALAAIDKDRRGLERARQNMGLLQEVDRKYGMHASLLAAIGIRESNFTPAKESGNTKGIGEFQIDMRFHSKSITADGAMNIRTSAFYMGSILRGWYDEHVTAMTSAGYSLNSQNSMLAIAASIHSYNSGKAFTRVYDRQNKGQFVYTLSSGFKGALDQKNIGPLDAGTTNNDYVSSIWNIATDCFGFNKR